MISKNDDINNEQKEPFGIHEGEFGDNERDDIKIQIRLGFIRKVYGILSFQLLITVIMSLIAMTSKSVQNFLVQNFALFILNLIVVIAFPYIIICFNGLMRQVPYNYIILFIFTFSESYFVAFICAYTNPKVVFMAAVMTFGIVISLTIYAITTKTDFTMKGGLIFILGMSLILLIIFGYFTDNKIYHTILSALGVIMFGIYLIYDTQLIVGNKSLILEADDYIYGAFNLYIDIITIFLELLKLFRINNN